jgi:hypothetical protein
VKKDTVLEVIILNTLINENGHVMVDAVTCWPLTMESQVFARVSLCGICSGHSDIGTDYSEFFSSLSLSFHHSSPYSCLMWGMNNRPFGGCRSETQSVAINTNMKIFC